MNILWIEDFDVRGPEDFTAATTLVTPLFNSLIPELDITDFQDKISDTCADQDNTVKLDRVAFKREVEDVIRQATIHELKICFSPQETIIELECRKDMYDVIIVDINLSLANEPWSNNGEDVNLQRAGIILFHKLIFEYGIPVSNICYYTNNDGCLVEINKAEVDNHVNYNSFGKSDIEELSEFIAKLRDDKYMKLRRGIISGCQFVQDCINKYVIENNLKELYHFWKYYENSTEKEVLKVKLDNNETLCINDFLLTLKSFFPFKIPNDKERSSRFALFLLALSHEWDDKVVHSKFKDVKNYHERIIQQSFGNIAKVLRNWLSHGILKFDSFTEDDVAFLFIVTLRTMFNLSYETMAYEKVLLDIFLKPDSTIDKIVKQKIKTDLSNSYSELIKKGESNFIKEVQYSDILKKMARENIKSSDENYYKRSLYRMFWHNSSKVRRTVTQDNGTVSIICKFEIFDYSKIEIISDLGIHIYKKAF